MSNGNCSSCYKPLGRGNKSGMCRSCVCQRLNTDPEMHARKVAGTRKKYEDPAWVAAKRAKLIEIGRRPDVIEKRRIRGREHAKAVLTRPDVWNRTQTPEARARAGRKRSETVMGWCPPELRDEYRDLVRSKRIPAAEARAIIEERIPGTAAHGRRMVAQSQLNMRLKNERDQMQAY